MFSTASQDKKRLVQQDPSACLKVVLFLFGGGIGVVVVVVVVVCTVVGGCCSASSLRYAAHLTVGPPEQVSLVVACLLFKAFLFQTAMSMTARHSLQNTFDVLTAINLIVL